MSAPVAVMEEQTTALCKESLDNPDLENVLSEGIPDGKAKDEVKTAEATLSKNQLKKLQRKERWDQVKGLKRKAEKQRHKANKQACRERGEDVGPSRKQLKYNKMSMSSCRVRVAIDCDFDQYMAEKDIKMLVKQIQYSYSSNRRAANPLQFHCCGVSGKTRERFESIGDYQGWDVKFHTPGYLETFDLSSIVYLSSESPNVLDTLDDDKVYIIGGLVDHNHHKGLCHRLAVEKGVSHAQLPLSENLDMKTRKVLAINHVFDILLRYTETQDWQKALYTVLPARKGAVLKLGDEGTSVKSDSNRTSDAENNTDQSPHEDVGESCDCPTENACVQGKTESASSDTKIVEKSLQEGSIPECDGAQKGEVSCSDREKTSDKDL